MDINPINTKKNYQSIIEQLVNHIKEGKLEPGEKLPSERTLAEMFNVSRTSLREAFSAMEISGLVEIRPGEGTYVSDFNIAPFMNTISPLFLRNENMEKELLEFRKLLEIQAVELASLKSSPKDNETLKDIILYMKDSTDKGDFAAGVKADVEFHKAIFSMTNNFILIKAAECVASLLECSVKFNREKILKDAGNSSILYEQHKYIYTAMEKKDAATAKKAMEDHLNFVLSTREH